MLKERYRTAIIISNPLLFPYRHIPPDLYPVPMIQPSTYLVPSSQCTQFPTLLTYNPSLFPYIHTLFCIQSIKSPPCHTWYNPPHTWYPVPSAPNFLRYLPAIPHYFHIYIPSSVSSQSNHHHAIPDTTLHILGTQYPVHPISYATYLPHYFQIYTGHTLFCTQSIKSPPLMPYLIQPSTYLVPSTPCTQFPMLLTFLTISRYTLYIPSSVPSQSNHHH